MQVPGAGPSLVAEFAAYQRQLNEQGVNHLMLLADKMNEARTRVVEGQIGNLSKSAAIGEALLGVNIDTFA